MILSIRLHNFKIFNNETSFPLSKVNLLTGINGRGKSSLLQSLLLLSQTIEHDEFATDIFLNGSRVNLGTFKDLHNNESSRSADISLQFQIEIESLNNVAINLEYILQENLHDDRTISIKKVKIECESGIGYGKDKSLVKLEWEKQGSGYPQITITEPDGKRKSVKSQLSRLRRLIPFLPPSTGKLPFDVNTTRFNKIHYISADRLGPQDFYSKSNVGKFINVGKSGEYAANVLLKKKVDLVNPNLHIKEKQIGETLIQNIDATLETQVGYWLSEILDTPNVKVMVEDTRSDFVILLFKFGNQEVGYKPANVGFGYSYILPIIVSSLIAQKGEILIVENPEAHLHPKAQSHLTKFLAKVASCGVQVYVESHSEHILNALRVIAIDPNMPISNEDISVLYFQNQSDAPFVSIPINPDGGINVWPEGFFDQSDKDFKLLFGL